LQVIAYDDCSSQGPIPPCQTSAPKRVKPSIEINNRLFFRLFQVANTLHTKGTQAIEEFGVTTQQWSVLGALSRPQAVAGMSSMTCRATCWSAGRTSPAAVRLERDGLVERATSEEDRRSRKVKLSEKGMALWGKLAEPIHTFYDAMPSRAFRLTTGWRSSITSTKLAAQHVQLVVQIE
jgi:DNA-binding MarR family transcriptional regulator